MSDLTHLDEAGRARMVDISGKAPTERLARASGSIRMEVSTLAAIRDNQIAKGDVLSVARIAGIMGGKRTADLVPLCHPVSLSDLQLQFLLDDSLPGIRVEATAKTTGSTGVEMEAIMAVSVSLVTIYDMAKGVDKGMEIGQISLIEKLGGKSGVWVRGSIPAK
jgi:cyclic pyranopterin monophosphate synthase